MKIALFSDIFLPGKGGMEGAVDSLAKELNKKNEVLVVAPTYGLNKGLIKNENYNLVRIKSTYVLNGTYLAHPNLDKKNVAKILDFNPDIIHVHSNDAIASLAIKLKQKRNIPVVTTLHTKFYEVIKSTIKSGLIARIFVKHYGKIFNNSDKVTVVCDELNKEIKLYTKKPIETVTVRNGCNEIMITHKPKSIALQYGINPDDFVLVYVGHLVKYKNVDMTIKALAKLQDKSIKFIIVGQGPENKALHKLASDLNVLDQCIFTGYIEDKTKVADIYNRSNLLCLLSYADNNPLVVNEAAYFQTPTISIKNTGTSEVILDGINGYTTEFNIDSYANKLNYIKNDNNYQSICSKAKQTIPKTWQEVSNDYLEIYKEILNKKAIEKRNAKETKELV